LYLLAAVLALGFTLPGSAAASTNSGNGMGRGGDDETIGTLPIMGGQHPLPLYRHVRDSKVSFYLEGNYDEILSTIIGYTGTGRASVESLPNGMVRLGFHGQLEIQLDRGLLQVTGIEIGSRVPETFRGAAISSGFQGQLGPAGRLRAGDHDLPIAGLDGQGLLGQAPWILEAHSRSSGNYELHATADAGILYVGQTY
jgi:hypothetical protein